MGKYLYMVVKNDGTMFYEVFTNKREAKKCLKKIQNSKTFLEPYGWHIEKIKNELEMEGKPNEKK